MGTKTEFTPLEINISNQLSRTMEQRSYGINKKFLTGFTKKDLVVVLCCVAFLLISLAAVGENGRRRAKEAVCLSNLRQWGNVFQMYANDYDGKFMQGWIPDSVGDTSYKAYWMEALRPYYGNNPDLRCCPEAAIPGTAIGQGPFGGVPPNPTFSAWGVFPGEDCGEGSPVWSFVAACDYGSYGMNGYLCNPPPGCDNIFGRPTRWNWRTANVAGADNIPLFTGNQWLDAWPHHTDPPPYYKGMPWGIDHTWHMLRVCIDRHNGSVNSAFLDYSARKVPLKCLWKLKWHRTFDLERGPSEAEFNATGTGWMGSLPPCE